MSEEKTDIEHGETLTNKVTKQYFTSTGSIIPSPFKRALFWPDVKEKTGKRTKKEKLPSVATSKQWQEYHSKKTQIKKENEERKQERARERQLKKENMAIEKALKEQLETKHKQKSNKKGKCADLSSHSEDTWIE
ncbi:hypothetical protein QE152_g9327 [Popillia japonica]|uniref:Uncharacterized protein n=1 Tax=Popillia japonica TaxID=7064 RepID=A0AAW1LV15_POPJA